MATMLALAAMSTACGEDAQSNPKDSPEGVSTTSPTEAQFLGKWVHPKREGPLTPAIELLSDGSVTGNDGCHEMSGAWKFAPDVGAARIGGLAITSYQACSNADGTKTWQKLNATKTLDLEGANLVARDQDGDQITTLERQGSK